jgi:hypothetical protein
MGYIIFISKLRRNNLFLVFHILESVTSSVFSSFIYWKFIRFTKKLYLKEVTQHNIIKKLIIVHHHFFVAAAACCHF